MPRETASVFPPPSDVFQRFSSRRSVVHSTKGMVACTQPLAAKCGINVLEAGGNAADAAVAVAAGLNLTEPCSTGIGGDMFCLYYDAKTGKVSALNGSGRAGNQFTLERIRSSLGLPAEAAMGDKIPLTSVHAVTVPGAAAGWVDTVKLFGSGKLSMEQVLAPAIKLGDEGYPVSELTATFWQKSEAGLREASPNFAEWLKKDPAAKPDGYRAPRAGEIMRNPTLAQTFRTLATEGKEGFYTGRIAEAIVEVVQARGGHLDVSDLKYHLETGSERVEPISLKYGDKETGVEVWEHPPNGQGIIALMALGILQELQSTGVVPKFGPADYNTAPYLHAIIESLRIAFADANWFVTDPNEVDVPVSGLLAPEYLAERAKLFLPTEAAPSHKLEHGTPGGAPFRSPAWTSSDTVYFAVADAEGNAISFINSNFGGFGTSIVPKGCGFSLQNRGANFSLDPRHPNVIAPRKRPYHTIIPGLVTNQSDNSLFSVFGVMGGFMQPQGHVQTLLGQLAGGANPQQALDAPRICIGSGMPDEGDVFAAIVSVEETMPEETIAGLRALGHDVRVVKDKARALFGRGQIIRYTKDPVEDIAVWSAGSDPRGDGGAYPL
ncbi:gamma-glutamyltransferase [Sporothrix schenckii ATCC 58251]|uniref:Gamma-glutamyltransferase n=1 Tax=Sporothrix schenckii (strain ATCC 58251 / de Perez 2211183) TaxID=1391915 RepID=U7Q7S9_SPOS1|nr:gamma-glutamyltransferase [Sporothrix schenckii ATCC 58251]